MAAEQSREILLAPHEYAYMQKEGPGTISVHVGPGAINATQQDVPISYEPKDRKYNKHQDLKQAVKQFPRASEGQYAILENPSLDGLFPSESNNTAAKPIQVGQRIVIPGPFCKPLWPGQSATVLDGHALRTNQFLVAVVYNEKQAEANWDQTIIKPATPTGDEGADQPKSEQKKGLQKPDTFATGSRIVIRGSDVSFYIPPTGIEVQIDQNTGKYVREAETLERLEYACLIDESGKKEYPIGPQVVFPRATQIFDIDRRKRRKWRAIELNTINGLHLKVVADFKGPDITQPAKADGTREERQYKEGEELFITGNALSIYYPREEFNIIEYGQGNKKHYSTAIPKGEGRYVMTRESGKIELIRGEKMLLADPRHQIPVRRILSQEECDLMYPGNIQAKDYNTELATVMAASFSGRSGLVSEGDWRKSQAKKLRSMGPAASYLSASDVIGADEDDDDYEAPESVSPEAYKPTQAGDAGGSGGTITRGTKYTAPRQLVLNTKYEGVPKVEVWPGYAVLVVGAEGKRRVVEGPQPVLLEYDEKLGFLNLSTGKPKNTDKLLKTAYLQVYNNQVSDVVAFESSDHVKGKVKISLRVNFFGETEDEKLKWFSVENYVKYLCDHVRSLIAGRAKKYTIAQIKTNYVDLTRDAVLGEKPEGGGVRPGKVFDDNGMRINDVEVLEIKLDDPAIDALLNNAQLEVVKTDISLDQGRKRLEATKETERLNQETARATFATEQLKRELESATIEGKLALTIALIESQLSELERKNKGELDGLAVKLEIQKAAESIEDQRASAKLLREKSAAEQGLAIKTNEQKLKIDYLTAETKSAVERFNAAKDGLSETLLMLGRDDMAARLAEACNVERYLSGDSATSAIANLLSIAPSLKAMFDKADAAQTKRLGNNRLVKTANAD